MLSASTELSGWIRYDGYYLSGHTAKVLSYAASEMDCWESCLQETSFLCLALASATRGNRTCLLYDTKALFHYADWTSAAGMTYYEYCQNGNTKCSQLPLNVIVISRIIQHFAEHPWFYRMISCCYLAISQVQFNGIQQGIYWWACHSLLVT